MNHIEAFDIVSTDPLFACIAPGCTRFTHDTYCCIWCVLAVEWHRQIDRHTPMCDYCQDHVTKDFSKEPPQVPCPAEPCAK